MSWDSCPPSFQPFPGEPLDNIKKPQNDGAQFKNSNELFQICHRLYISWELWLVIEIWQQWIKHIQIYSAKKKFSSGQQRLILQLPNAIRKPGSLCPLETQSSSSWSRQKTIGRGKRGKNSFLISFIQYLL